VINVLIVNGTIVDGSGNPGYQASVAVEGDRLRIVRGDVTIPAERVIDARGLTVAPGFIDMHSHSGLMILADPAHHSKVRQGVTTEVIGVDGNSYAPFTRREDLLSFVEFNAGLDGSPDIPYDWDTVASYLSRFDQKVAVNIAFFIGNCALRICALGWHDQPADPQIVNRMKAMLREGMEEGAFGLSTGLDYPPGSYATTDELARLGAEAARMGGIYHTHVRYRLGDRYLDPFREAIEIGRRGGVPVHITHFYHRAGYPGGTGRMLDLVEEARVRGLDVTFDTYPYEWASTRLLIELPGWVQSGGPSELKSRLADPSVRVRLHEDMRDRWRPYGGIPSWAGDLRLGYFARPEHEQFEGRTLAEIAEVVRQNPIDALLDLLLKEDLRLNEVRSGPQGATLPPFVKHTLGMVGTDSVFLGRRPSPRTYGSFPRILGDFVREERLLSLPEAIRKMTSYPAQRLGILDRGLLRDGLRADIVVFDQDKIRAVSTYDEPCQYPVGLRHVLVNGQLVINEEQHTGALPGRALRRRRTSSP
jgi:N-acyl-D-amino-acid deacylase